MKEHSSNQEKTTSKANANQPFFQKKSKQKSFFKSEEGENNFFSKRTSFTPPPLNSNSTSIQRKKNKNLPKDLQAKMEDSFGQNISNVKIHKNSRKAIELNARAFTQGDSIHFAPNEFNPNSNKGKKLIAHEFTHIMQQAQGRVKPTTQVKGMSVNDDKDLEKEADVMGAKMLQSKLNIPQATDNEINSKYSKGQVKQRSTQDNLNRNGTVLQMAKCKGEKSGAELTPEAKKFLDHIIQVAEKTPSFWEIVCPNIKQIDAKHYKAEDDHTEWGSINEDRVTTINLNTHVSEGGFFFRDPTATYGTLLHEAMHGMGPLDEERKDELGSHTDMAWRNGLDQIVNGMREFDMANATKHSYSWYYAIASRGIPDERTRISGTGFAKIASEIRTNEDRYEEFLKENNLLQLGKSTYSIAHAKFLLVDWNLFKSTRKSSSPAEKSKIIKQLQTAKEFE